MRYVQIIRFVAQDLEDIVNMYTFRGLFVINVDIIEVTIAENLSPRTLTTLPYTCITLNPDPPAVLVRPSPCP